MSMSEKVLFYLPIVIFFVLCVCCVDSNALNLEKFSVEKHMFIKNDPKYECNIIDNEIISYEKLQYIDKKTKIKKNDKNSKLDKITSKSGDKNRLMLKKGFDVQCGDECDIFTIGDKDYLNISDGIMSTIFDVQIYDGEVYLDPSYDIPFCPVENGNKWNISNLNHEFNDNHYIVFNLKSDHDIFFDPDKNHLYSVTDSSIYYDFLVVEDTCWDNNTVESCLDLYNFSYTNNESLKNMSIFITSTNGWGGFSNDTEIDPIVYKEDVGESSVIGSDWQTRLILNNTVDESNDYLIISNMESAHNDVGSSMLINLFFNGVLFYNISIEPKDYDKNNYYISTPMIIQRNNVVGSNIVNISVSNNIITETTYTKNVRISAIKLYDNIFNKYEGTLSIDQSNVSVLSITNITTPDDYLVMFSGTHSSASTSSSSRIYMKINNDIVSENSVENKDPTDIYPFVGFDLKSLDSSSNISIIPYSTSGNSIIRNPKINVVRLNNFYYGNSTSNNLENTSSSTYVTKLSYDMDIPETQEYLVLAYAEISSQFNVDQAIVEFQVDGVQYCEMALEPKEVNGNGDYYPFFCNVNKTLSSGSVNAKINHKAQSGGVSMIRNAKIVYLSEKLTSLGTKPYSSNFNYTYGQYNKFDDVLVSATINSDSLETVTASFEYYLNNVLQINNTYYNVTNGTQINDNLSYVYTDKNDNVTTRLYLIDESMESENYTINTTIQAYEDPEINNIVFNKSTFTSFDNVGLCFNVSVFDGYESILYYSFFVNDNYLYSGSNNGTGSYGYCLSLDNIFYSGNDKINIIMYVNDSIMSSSVINLSFYIEGDINCVIPDKIETGLISNNRLYFVCNVPNDEFRCYGYVSEIGSNNTISVSPIKIDTAKEILYKDVNETLISESFIPSGGVLQPYIYTRDLEEQNNYLVTIKCRNNDLETITFSREMFVDYGKFDESISIIIFMKTNYKALLAGLFFIVVIIIGLLVIQWMAGKNLIKH